MENKAQCTHIPLLLCIGLGFKSDIAPSTLTFNVPSSFAFLVFVFVFCWPFTKLNFRWKVFCKTFRIIELGGTSFLLEFQVKFSCFFHASFLCAFLLYHCIMLIWVWFERSLPLTPVRSKSKVSVSIKSDFTSSTRDVDLHGWLQTVLGCIS